MKLWLMKNDIINSSVENRSSCRTSYLYMIVRQVVRSTGRLTVVELSVDTLHLLLGCCLLLSPSLATSHWPKIATFSQIIFSKQLYCRFDNGQLLFNWQRWKTRWTIIAFFCNCLHRSGQQGQISLDWSLIPSLVTNAGKIDESSLFISQQ